MFLPHRFNFTRLFVSIVMRKMTTLKLPSNFSVSSRKHSGVQEDLVAAVAKLAWCCSSDDASPVYHEFYFHLHSRSREFFFEVRMRQIRVPGRVFSSVSSTQIQVVVGQAMKFSKLPFRFGVSYVVQRFQVAFYQIIAAETWQAGVTALLNCGTVGLVTSVMNQGLLLFMFLG